MVIVDLGFFVGTDLVFLFSVFWSMLSFTNFHNALLPLSTKPLGFRDPGSVFLSTSPVGSIFKYKEGPITLLL